jgi:hypothetical protein
MALALPLPLAGEGWGEGPTSPQRLDKEIFAFSVFSVSKDQLAMGIYLAIA